MEWFRNILIAILIIQSASAELTNGLYAAFDTSMGSFTCRLDYAEAPLTCANFVGLAEGGQAWVSTNGAVKSDAFYDGLTFHRVIDGFMIQGGCPLGTGTSGPGYAFPDELTPDMSDYENAGVLVMANSGANSNGSQFFITLVPQPGFDDVSKYMVFGEVVDGMNVVSDIGLVAVGTNDRPLTNVVINAVQILRVGAAAAAFDPVLEPLPEVSRLALTLSEGVAAVNSNQCAQFIFSSTNLFDWTSGAQNYSPIGGAKLSLEIASNQASGFYRGARVFYPQASTVFSNLEGRDIFFYQEAYTLDFSPEAGGLGTCDIAGTPDTITYWEEWTSEPYVARVVFQPSGMNAFQFYWPRSGPCEGYQYSASGWQYIGLWGFGERNVIPE
ncbi:peptidylprolyl isomerase [Pontiellaceae bacterium B12227]|nr:peptidylprolyl isomerase [Pontiellaceae bacterium B12227]